MISQEGGKLIGQGTYGCVYKPAIPCTRRGKEASDIVSKVMIKRHARDEAKELDKISSIDKKKEYYLGKPKQCNLDDEYVDYIMTNVDGIEDCKAIELGFLQGIDILQYKDGGMDLSKFFQTMKKGYSPQVSKKLLLNIRPLLMGLVEMKKHNYSHSDIKTLNIVINPKTYRMYYIDFGLAQSYARKINNQYLYKAGYFAFPMETVLMTDYPSRYRNSNDLNSQAKEKYERSYAKVIERKVFAYGTPYSFDFRKYPSDWTPKKVIQQVDTFSLGLVLAELYTEMKHRLFNMAQNNNTVPYLSHFYTLINGMIKPHYYERFTPEQALSYYDDNILPLVGGKKSKKTEKTLIKKDILKRPPEIHEVVAKSIMKECPKGKILNPKTNRCVNETGAIGKKLKQEAEKILQHKKSVKAKQQVKAKQAKKTKKVSSKKESLIKKIRIKKTKKRIVLKSIKKTKKSTTSKPKKVCPPTKVLNPKTNRCVNKDGVVAKKLGLV